MIFVRLCGFLHWWSYFFQSVVKKKVSDQDLLGFVCFYNNFVEYLVAFMFLVVFKAEYNPRTLSIYKIYEMNVNY